MKRIEDINVGDKFGEWTVISDEVKTGNNRALYLKCKCRCGREAWKQASLLRNNRMRACKTCCKDNLFRDTFSNTYFEQRIKRRAKIRGFDFDLDYEYIYDLIIEQDFKCALSGLAIAFRAKWGKGPLQTASLDRIDNSKGYLKGNVQWVHKDVNMMKGKLKEERFLELCKLISRKNE